MDLTKRQKRIVDLTRQQSPMTSEQISQSLKIGVTTIRSDLRLLTAVGILNSRPKVGYEYAGQQDPQLDFAKLYETEISQILKTPAFVKPNTSLQECVNMLFLKDAGSLYVVDETDNLLGLISRKDLLAVTVNNTDTDSMVASMVMTRMPNLITVTPEMTILEVGMLLLKHEVDSLPVVDKKNPREVVGKITKNRIFQYFVEIGNEQK
ncbi:CBS domain-containing protein [Companilactobacillus mishanensis]|uniref:CBS domain-containing protein n=1 Tax=Companilactobacillus mishanensis TaxID=2486008 RepID=A0ABW9P7T9_9LACO|nr:CBS domain-containing protein [Companilactobacillus mishanensis]MQS45174.1 CBS domain-containing protein [Companilactobacillus mishanensis]MQS89560.1 CBS domain-containing protein [Companilactobacillus mishanensis]